MSHDDTETSRLNHLADEIRRLTPSDGARTIAPLTPPNPPDLPPRLMLQPHPLSLTLREWMDLRVALNDAITVNHADGYRSLAREQQLLLDKIRSATDEAAERAHRQDRSSEPTP